MKSTTMHCLRCGRGFPVRPSLLTQGRGKFCSRACYWADLEKRTPRESVEERFWSKVDRRGADECWPWRASRTPYGHGRFYVGGHGHNAHRFAYGLLVGRIADLLELDHLCRNPWCVNPAHLEPVTHAENIRRGEAPNARPSRTGRCNRGHELTAENVYIRRDRPGTWNCRACDRERHAARKVRS